MELGTLHMLPTQLHPSSEVQSLNSEKTMLGAGSGDTRALSGNHGGGLGDSLRAVQLSTLVLHYV